MKHKFHVSEQTIWNECQIKEKELHVAYLLTYSMEQNLSWEAKQFTASQEIPINMESQGSLPRSQVPATCTLSWASLIQSIPQQTTA